MKNLKFLGLSKYAITTGGEVYSHFSYRFLKRYVGEDGYHKLTLTNDSGKVEYWRLCRLLAFAYCDGHAEGLVVNHKDGIKTNDVAHNLEWTTISGNTIHAIENSLQLSAGGKDLTEIPTVHEICRMLEQGYRKKDIADMLEVAVRTVTEIQNKTYWKSISDEYNINYIKKDFKLNPEKVLRICKDLSEGYNLVETANRNSVGTSTVHRIRKRQTYTDISKPFHF